MEMKDEVSLSSHHIKDTYYQHYLSLGLLTWITWHGRVCRHSLSFPYSIHWTQITKCNPYSRGWRAKLHLRKGHYTDILCGKFVSFLFTFSIVYLYPHDFMDIHYTLWVIIQ